MSKALYKDRTCEIRYICQTLHISRSTLYRYQALPDDESALAGRPKPFSGFYMSTGLCACISPEPSATGRGRA